MATLRKEVESAVQRRDLPDARRLITRFLKAGRNDLESRYEASEFYRRISDFSSALRVLRIQPDLRSWAKLSEIQLRHQLQSARILNLLGASSRALKTLSQLPEKTKRALWPQTGGILASNFQSVEALPYYEPLESLPESELGYLERLQSVTLADCCFGAGNFERARGVLERVIRLSKEPLLLGIAHQALGSYAILRGQLAEGAQALERSERFFPAADTTLDRGFLEKWRGALAASRGDFAQARERLAKAWQLIYRPGTKPEAWLEVLYWVGFCDFRERPGVLPLPWARLLCFPSPGQRMISRIGEQIGEQERLLLSFLRLERDPGALHLDPGAQAKAFDSRYRLGMTDPERLAAALIAAGPEGLPQYRAYDVLWPDEPFSFSQHQKRLEQLVLRNRATGSALEWRELHLTWAAPRDGVTVLWTRAARARGAPFLESRGEGLFSRKDVENFFAVSKSTASELLRKWTESGSCQGVKIGKIQEYQVIGSSAHSRN